MQAQEHFCGLTQNKSPEFLMISDMKAQGSGRDEVEGEADEYGRAAWMDGCTVG